MSFKAAKGYFQKNSKPAIATAMSKEVVDNDCANFNIMKVVGNVFENPELLN